MCNAESDPPGRPVVGHCSKHGCFGDGTSCTPNCDYACNPPYVDQNTVPVGTQYQFVGRFCCNGCDNCMNCVLIVTPTPTPTLTPTLTPTPTGSLACNNLNPSNSSPKLGDTITLNCEKSASYTAAVTYDFMLIKKANITASDPNPTPTPFVRNSNNATTTYTFPTGQYGYYLLMCRVCAGATCTDWQKPRVAVSEQCPYQCVTSCPPIFRTTQTCPAGTVCCQQQQAF